MKVLNEKYILKQATRDWIPVGARTRTKQPYRAPDVAAFFTQGKPREEYVAELLDPERIRKDGIFNPGAVAKLCAKARNGTAIGIKDSMSLTAILSTQLWLHHFFSAPQPQTIPGKEPVYGAL